MIYTTITFSGEKATAPYTCTCGGCGKTLNRKATVEHTVNPFNKNAAGEVKTRAEVRSSAREAAIAEAAKLEGSTVTCRDCEEAPRHALLLEMAADPEKVFPAERKTWGSPMDILYDRKQVDYVHVRCDCKSDCCSGWKRNPGLRITKKGLERAATLRKKGAV